MVVRSFKQVQNELGIGLPTFVPCWFTNYIQRDIKQQSESQTNIKWFKRIGWGQQLEVPKLGSKVGWKWKWFNGVGKTNYIQIDIKQHSPVLILIKKESESDKLITFRDISSDPKQKESESGLMEN